VVAMPVADYGVVVGTFNRLTKADYVGGHWFHGYLYVDIPGGENVGALDVYATTAVGVEYRILFDLDPVLFAPLAALPNGRHNLASGPVDGPTSGALDYVRSRMLKPRLGCLPRIANPIVQILALLGLGLIEAHGWIPSDGDNALDALEPQLQEARRVFMFGSLFETGPNGPGVHDTHMNQGDPVPPAGQADHQSDDGVWQDGAVIIERTDGRIVAWLVKFSTQTLNTNNTTGLPL
jgi:hypothetical protein